MVRITERGRRIDEKEVAALELELGKSLPDVYRNFLLQNNGGRPEPECVDISELEGSPTDIQIFFGIGRDVESSNLSWNRELISNYSQAEKVLPIACDSGGNIFCLDISLQSESSVLYLELSDDEYKIYTVAPSFESFMAKIRHFNDAHV